MIKYKNNIRIIALGKTNGEKIIILKVVVQEK